MTQVAISTDFLDALHRIPRAQQKKVRNFITRFRLNPTAASINYEPIHNMRDPRVRTVRIDLAYRAIVLHPEQDDIYVLMWVDHHDEAMAWAQHKLFEVNPVTGALQVLDSEMIAEANRVATDSAAEKPKALADYALFETFSNEDLLRTGLPEPLLPAVRALDTADQLDELQPYLPAEAYEALFWIANLGYSIDQAIAETSAVAPVAAIDTSDVGAAFQHPDTLRRFAIIDSPDELNEILNAPLDKWRTFLHPSQAKLVRRHFNGPARVLGGAGTGKTVVAMHRARHLARAVFTEPADRILFTTFTRNLATNIERNLANLCGPEAARIEVTNLHRWATRFLQSQGFRLDIAAEREINECWRAAVSVADSQGFNESFYRAEWQHVIQAHAISTRQEYLRAGRHGRGTRLTRPQRAAVWAVFDEYRRLLAEIRKMEWFDLIRQCREYLASQKSILPYRAIVVDETQDLHPEELRLIRQMIPPGPNDLFFVGDAHQRIYGRPVVMGHCGVEIRGRSSKLRINYRTTEEIRNWSVGVLAGQTIDDLDGGHDTFSEYTSLMHGAEPVIRHFDTPDAELAHLIDECRTLLEVTPAESICIVARTQRQISDHYASALTDAGIECTILDAHSGDTEKPGIRLATMHRVKGLEFAHMRIAGVNANVIPAMPNENELDQVGQAEAELRERCVLHVAATRARNTLGVSSYGQPSRFIE